MNAKKSQAGRREWMLIGLIAGIALIAEFIFFQDLT
jgi:hypothetical protein